MNSLLAAIPPREKIQSIEKPETKPLSEKDIIAGLQKIVSSSRLGTFLQCRLKFYFRYVAQIKKAKTAALFLGNAVHETLKAWNKTRWKENRLLSLKELHDEFSKAWAEQSKEEPVNWEGEEEAEKLTGWRLLETYMRQYGLYLSIKPEAVEVPIEADLVNHGLPKLVGVLDLVQQRRVVDYKTSGTTPKEEQAAHTHEVQTCTYAVLYREANGQRELGIELHSLVKLKNPKLSIIELPPMSDSQQTRLFHLMEAYVEGLERKDFVPSPGFGCMSCEFFNECRRWS
jgi:putative RecB family exonuclease